VCAGCAVLGAECFPAAPRRKAACRPDEKAFETFDAAWEALYVFHTLAVPPQRKRRRRGPAYRGRAVRLPLPFATRRRLLLAALDRVARQTTECIDQLTALEKRFYSWLESSAAAVPPEELVRARARTGPSAARQRQPQTQVLLERAACHMEYESTQMEHKRRARLLHPERTLCAIHGLDPARFLEPPAPPTAAAPTPTRGDPKAAKS
jgi:hypothetical protein